MSKKTTPDPLAPEVQESKDRTGAKQKSAADKQDPEKWSLMAIQSAPYGVMVHDSDGNVLIFNSQLEKISGYRKDEIPDVAAWIQKVYPDKEYRQLVLDHRKSEISKDRRRVRSAIITRKDGEKRICEFSSVLSSAGIRTVFIKDTSTLRRVEDSLRESEERFRLLTEAAFEGIIIHKNGVLLNANDQFFEMFGYQAGEVLGRQAIDMLIAPASVAFIKKQIRKGTSTPYEVMGLKKDGTIFPILIHAKTMEYQESEVRVAAIRDLSYRKQTESELRKSEAQLSAVIESLPFDFFMLDKNGYYVMQNSICRFRWGNIVGKKPEDMEVDDATLSSWLENNRRAFAGETVRGEIEISVDGKKRHFHNIISPIYDSEYLIGILGVNIDITNLKNAERALRESEEKFRTVSEQSPNMIFINRLGRVVYANPRWKQLMGYSRDEFYAPEFDFLELVAPESRQLIQSAFKRHMQGEDIEPYEYALIDKKGRRIEVIITTKLINYEGKRSILGIVTDITERKQAEDALQAKDRAMERQAQSLEEMNTALKVLLEQHEKEKAEVKEALLANIKKLIFPYIEKLETRRLDDNAQTYVNIVRSNLSDLISPLASSLSSKYFELTPSEIQVADLIKAGKTSKDIASMLNVSPKAVSFHRGNLRKKLGLVNKKINLRTYLQSFPQ